MNWVTTNIRLPKDVYMDLKIQAAKRRTSIAAIIREKVTQTKVPQDSNTLLTELKTISNKIVKSSNKKNLTKSLIKNRYEHI